MMALAGQAAEHFDVEWQYGSKSKAADGENYLDFDDDEQSVLLALYRDDYFE